MANRRTGSGGRRMTAITSLVIASIALIAYLAPVDALVGLTFEATSPAVSTPTLPEPSTSIPVETAAPPPSGRSGQWSFGPAPSGLQAEGLVRWIAGRFVLFGPAGRVWSSLDGSSWTARPDLPGADEGTQVADVASVGSTYLAVGRAATGAPVWLSEDGLSWSRLPEVPALKDAAMLAVASGPEGLVAVGQVGERSVVWTSGDGRTWERLPDQKIFGQLMLAVAGGPFGYAITGAVARCEDLCAGDGPPIWTSPDGRRWQLVKASSVGPEAPGKATSIAVGANRIVAVGVAGVDGNRLMSSAVWVSADGQRWSRRLIGDAAPAYIATVSGGFIGVGHGIWGSTDGVAWSSLIGSDPYPGGFLHLDSVACRLGRCVATGMMDGGTTSGAVVWWGPAVGTSAASAPVTTQLSPGDSARPSPMLLIGLVVGILAVLALLVLAWSSRRRAGMR